MKRISKELKGLIAIALLIIAVGVYEAIDSHNQFRKNVIAKQKLIDSIANEEFKREQENWVIDTSSIRLWTTTGGKGINSVGGAGGTRGSFSVVTVYGSGGGGGSGHYAMDSLRFKK